MNASGKSEISKISVSAFFDYTWYHGLPLNCDKIVVKSFIHRKIFVVVFIHIANQISKHLRSNKNNLQWYVLNRGHMPENCFLNDLSLTNTSLFNQRYDLTFIRRKLCYILTLEVMQSWSCDSRFRRYESILRYPLWQQFKRKYDLTRDISVE